MSIITQAGAFVLVSLIIVNGILGGGVADAIGTFATDEEKEQARADIMCGTGYLLYTPIETYTILGMDIDVPMPSYANVILAALIAMSMIMVIRITTGIKWKFKYALGIFVGTWVGLKILGLILMGSVDGCMVWAETMVEQTSGFYEVAALGGSLYGLKIIWGIRK